jgi:hypothetical protein
VLKNRVEEVCVGGIYRHQKGSRYRVWGVALEKESSKFYVIYAAPEISIPKEQFFRARLAESESAEYLLINQSADKMVATPTQRVGAVDLKKDWVWARSLDNFLEVLPSGPRFSLEVIP